MNSNPYPELETYVSIQLFEPYNDLFYIARRLKFYKVISYYRLDENGHTHIALNENCRAFKFSNVDQLRQLNIAIPNEIYKDLYQRKVWSAEADTQAAAKELSRATEFRPVDPARTESGARSQQQKEVIEVSTEKAPTEPALTVEKVYTVPPPKAPSESLQNKILHEDNQQQLPSFHSIQQHPPGNYSQPFWYQQQYSGWHAGYLTNGRAGQAHFRFPNPDQNRRHSVKKGEIFCVLWITFRHRISCSIFLPSYSVRAVTSFS